MSWGQVWSLVNVGIYLGSLINTSQSFGAISNDQQGFGSMLGEYLIFEEKAQSRYLINNNNNNFKTPLYGSLKLELLEY
jgi:hypothetical protein